MTPSWSQFPTPELGASTEASPVVPGLVSMLPRMDRSIAPKSLGHISDSDYPKSRTDRHATKPPRDHSVQTSICVYDRELGDEAHEDEAGVHRQPPLESGEPTVCDSIVSCGNKRV